MQLDHERIFPRLPPASASKAYIPASDRTLRATPRGRDDWSPLTPGQLDLIHYLDLRARYRTEESSMRTRLDALQAALETTSRQLWHYLASGAPAPNAVRVLCDELVADVEAVERDLADVRLAIEGVVEEIAMHLRRRQRRR